MDAVARRIAGTQLGRELEVVELAGLGDHSFAVTNRGLVGHLQHPFSGLAPARLRLDHVIFMPEAFI